MFLFPLHECLTPLEHFQCPESNKRHLQAWKLIFQIHHFQQKLESEDGKLPLEPMNSRALSSVVARCHKILDKYDAIWTSPSYPRIQGIKKTVDVAHFCTSPSPEKKLLELSKLHEFCFYKADGALGSNFVLMERKKQFPTNRFSKNCKIVTLEQLLEKPIDSKSQNGLKFYFQEDDNNENKLRKSEENVSSTWSYRALRNQHGN